MKKKRLWSDIVIYSLLTIAALYTLFPLLMALMNSFKSNRECHVGACRSGKHRNYITDFLGCTKPLHRNIL